MCVSMKLVGGEYSTLLVVPYSSLEPADTDKASVNSVVVSGSVNDDESSQEVGASAESHLQQGRKKTIVDRTYTMGFL